MNSVEKGTRRVKYWLGFRDDSKLIAAIRPGYNKFLELLYGKRGLARNLGGVEKLRILPAHRYFLNDFEPDLFRFLNQTVRMGDTVIEVGANVGVFTTLLARWVGPKGRVVAFEPSPVARDALEKHLTLNGVAERVKVVSSAVSDAPGRSMFYEHGASGQNTLSSTHSRIPEARGVEVDVNTLDRYCRAAGVVPSLLKIDIEGFELHALRGARQILNAYKPLLAVELHPMNWPEVGVSKKDLEAFLVDMRYRASTLGCPGAPFFHHGHAIFSPVTLPGAKCHATE